MVKGHELGNFLRARRAATTPEAVGLPVYGHRRVPGLRRDEVAELAGVSLDYYTRLEQGRENRPSAQVLDALAHVFDLDSAQRRHVYALAQLLWTPPLPDTPAPLHSSLVQLMSRWPDAACFVLDPVLDIVGTNALTKKLFSAFARTDNLAAMVFLDPVGQTFYTGWERATVNCVANLRATSDTYVGARRRERLIDELCTGSAEFRQLWSTHEVQPKTHDTKPLFHPAVGAIRVDFDALEVASAPGHQLVVYRTEPGTVDAERLQALAAMSFAQLSAGIESGVPVR